MTTAPDFFEVAPGAITPETVPAPKRRGRPAGSKNKEAAPAGEQAPKKRGRPSVKEGNGGANKPLSFVSVMLAATQDLKDTDRDLFGKIATKLEAEPAGVRQRIAQALVRLFA